jgi:hypothetical protein
MESTLTVKPSKRLTELAERMRLLVAVIADPNTSKALFFNSRRDAIFTAKLLYREYLACHALAVIMDGWKGVEPYQPEYGPDTYVSPYAKWTPGRFAGD